MTHKLILLAGLLLSLSGQAFAGQAPAPVQTNGETAATAPAPQPQRLAWQRVGAPLSLEG